MKSFGNYLAQTIRAAALVATLAPTLAAAAETVEVVPGVQVTKRTYSAPVNEQPFFGFAAKSPEEKAADEKFVDAIVGFSIEIHSVKLLGWPSNLLLAGKRLTVRQSSHFYSPADALDK